MWFNYRVGWGSTKDLGKMGTPHPPILRWTVAISGIAPDGPFCTLRVRMMKGEVSFIFTLVSSRPPQSNSSKVWCQ
jgi:hypothetical protein